MRTCFVLLILLSSLSVSAEQPPYRAYDCTAVEIEEVDPATLTKEERISLMENALLDSVNRYSTCMDQVQQSMAAQQAGEGTGHNNTQATQQTQKQAQGQNEMLQQQAQNNTEVDDKERKAGPGREQQVVAPKDNDSIICTMLYEEIQKETNEATRSALLQQYEDYRCTQ
ncbi:hypothetical protein [Pseudoalteromonas ruthenica]|uniref:hypothetical protein n=1 Tax=Pseudoalteromonas ruthenica TaxID=151081 RepID=UPI000345B3A1|nr:hypothetical protein [Pseudoalteromonas ruthenica]